MSDTALVEITKFFRSYGIKYDENLIQEWLASPYVEIKYPVGENELYEFNEWSRWKGTAHEEGIDDQTKIERLSEEITDLRREIAKLNDEKLDLERKLGIPLF